MSIRKIHRFILNRSVPVILLTLIITAVMGYFALQVEQDSDANSLMPRKNDRILKLKEDLGVDSETTNFLFLSVSGEDLYNLETLQTFSDVIDDVLTLPDVHNVLTPFNFVYFESRGNRILPSMIVRTGSAPENREDLRRFEERIRGSLLARNFVVSGDGRTLTAIFTTGIPEDPGAFMTDFRETVRPLESAVRVRYTGEIPIGARIGFYLTRDFSRLLFLALGVMLAVFFLFFRSKRAVFLPVLVVSIGAVWSIGFMALAGFKLTIVSIIIPSLILTIGSSYTIHVLNEYFRNSAESGVGSIDWLVDAVEHVSRTVVLAALTTLISFISLLTTSMEPLRQFGLSISLGILFCALLALFFLPAVFNLMGPPGESHKKRARRGLLTRMVVSAGTFAAERKIRSVLLLVLLFLLYLLFYPGIRHQSDYFSYFPSRDRIIEDTRFIIRHTGGSQSFNITLHAPDQEEGYFLRPEVLQKVDLLEEALEANRVVSSKISFPAVLKSMNRAVRGESGIPDSRGLILLLNRYFRMVPAEKFSLGKDINLIDETGSRITIFLKVANPDSGIFLNEEELKEFHGCVGQTLDRTIGDSMDVNLWGNTLLLMDASRTIKRDQFVSTILSMILGFCVTALFFRSFVFSFLALIPLLSGIFCYFITLYVFRIPLDMTTILVTNITVGVGLDDAVHFILQYRTRRKSRSCEQALKDTLEITGRPIVLTTLSLVAGLLVLCFASFTPIVYFGLLVACSLFSTMAGTVFFLPAVISLYESAAGKKGTNEPGILSV